MYPIFLDYSFVWIYPRSGTVVSYINSIFSFFEELLYFLRNFIVIEPICILSGIF